VGRVIYFEEEQKGYTDSLDIYIPSQTVALGRLMFGPEVSRRWITSNGSVIAPYVGIQGIWDFERAEIVDLDTQFAAGSSKDFRGRVEAGFAGYFSGDWSIRGEAFYDGIGVNDLDAYGGNVRISIPLN
jgi:outer membrane autotransporter protein